MVLWCCHMSFCDFFFLFLRVWSASGSRVGWGGVLSFMFYSSRFYGAEVTNPIYIVGCIFSLVFLSPLVYVASMRCDHTK